MAVKAVSLMLASAMCAVFLSSGAVAQGLMEQVRTDLQQCGVSDLARVNNLPGTGPVGRMLSYDDGSDMFTSITLAGDVSSGITMSDPVQVSADDLARDVMEMFSDTTQLICENNQLTVEYFEPGGELAVWRDGAEAPIQARWSVVTRARADASSHLDMVELCVWVEGRDEPSCRHLFFTLAGSPGVVRRDEGDVFNLTSGELPVHSIRDGWPETGVER